MSTGASIAALRIRREALRKKEALARTAVYALRCRGQESAPGTGDGAEVAGLLERQQGWIGEGAALEAQIRKAEEAAPQGGGAALAELRRESAEVERGLSRRVHGLDEAPSARQWLEAAAGEIDRWEALEVEIAKRSGGTADSGRCKEEHQ